MKRLVLAILVVLSLAVTANAQTFRGAINGTVSDPSGASVPNAAVKATENATGIEHNSVTTSDGQFSFQDLPLGTYKVTVTATGFPALTVDNVTVTAGSIYTLPVKLTLQQQATTVEVSAAALAVDTTTQTQTMTLPDTIVQDIPLNGRDFTQLIAIAPGYGGYSVGGFGSLNGTRANQMNWQIDGTDNNDFWHNIPAVNQGGVSGIAGVVLPIDAIDEFSAQTQSSAETGRNAGGTVNLVIKSGGNTIHGSVYYYNRNEFYAAHSPFLPPGTKTPRLRNENYGFSVGGPIIKNKTFYFLAYEKEDYIIGLSGVATEPSDAWITKATDVLTNGNNTKKYGSYAPVTPSVLSGILIGQNGFWPRGTIGSLAGTLNNYFSSVASTGYSYNGVVKLDHNFSDKHHLSARWFVGQGSQTQPTGGSPALGSASSNLKDYFEVAPIHVQNYSLVFNSTLRPNLTNQVLFGVNYFNQIFHDFNNSFDTKALGLFLSPDAVINGKPIHGASNIAISGFEQVGITPPEGRNDITGHLTDIVSYTTGKHQFRFGGEVRQGRVNEFYFYHSLGSFIFDGTQGLWNVNPNDATQCNTLCQGLDINTKALADFLAGDVQSSSIAVGNAERHVTVNAYNLFFQDGWQITRKLNLNFGLRYEYFGPIHSDQKDLAVFIPGKGLVTQGNGIGSIFPPDKNNVAPRFGFAYQPTPKGDLVVRGGIGVFYDQINMNPFLDYRPQDSGADGLEGNPAGPHSVSSYSKNAAGQTSYTWVKDQQVFPGKTTCSGNFATDPGCLSATTVFNVFSVNQNFRAPYFFNYNLQVEKSLGSAAVFQIGYVGSEGRKLSVMLDINQASLANDPSNSTLQSRRPFFSQYPNFGTINQLNSAGTSNYNSFQTTLRIRAWHGLTSQFAYTWGHALDETSDYRHVFPQNSFNLKGDYGSSDFDTRHNFTTNLTYAVPGSSHGPKILTHGWQLSNLISLHTGQPVNLFALTDSSGTNDGQLRPNLIGNPFAGVSHKFSQALGGAPWINPAAFAQPAPGTFGNLGRNKFYGPSYASVDLSVLKNIPITERVKVQLRAEMFNLFNRINLVSGPGAFSLSGGGIANDTIGDFNGAPGIGPGEAFNMQLVAKIIF